MQQQTSIHERGSEGPHEIEARLEQDRQDVAQAFSALRDRFSPDSLWQDAADYIGRNAGSYTAAADRLIRGNPMALAVSAVGVAWFILGRKKDGKDAQTPALAGSKYEAVTRWEDEGGPVKQPPSTAPAHLDDWMVEADRLRDRAGVMLGQINKAARKGGAMAGDLARHRTEVMSALTTDVRRALGRGLEGLSDTARSAALKTREQAYGLHVQARRTSADVLHERPLASAAALAAAGAALGMVLPRSSVEDRYLGRTRDQIVAELSRVFEDERQRIAASAQVATEEMMASLSRPLGSRHSGDANLP